MSQDKQDKKADPTAEGSQNLYRRPEKPKRAEVKPLQILESATNEAGEVFNTGELIQVTSPWGGKVIAEITGFYQDTSGNAWAQHIPKESRSNWDWEGGCLQAVLLIKA